MSTGRLRISGIRKKYTLFFRLNEGRVVCINISLADHVILICDDACLLEARESGRMLSSQATDELKLVVYPVRGMLPTRSYHVCVLLSPLFHQQQDSLYRPPIGSHRVADFE